MQPKSPIGAALPAPLTEYFANETRSPEELARCFADDAVVIDEHHQHRGRTAIVAWNAANRAKYGFTSEPLTSVCEGDVVIVSAKVSGSFPGSPVTLRYHFTIKGGLITQLEIAP